MTTKRNNTRRFMKDMMHELLFNIDEASSEYSRNGDCDGFVMRMSRILYLINSYARIFDAFEIEEFTNKLSWAFLSLHKNQHIPSNRLLALTAEAKEYLLDMTEAAMLDPGEIVPLYSSRIAGITIAIAQLNASEKKPHFVHDRGALAVA